VAGKCPSGGEECDDENDIAWDGCTGGEITEFQVNSYESNDQVNAAAATFEDGGYVLVWQSEGQDGSGAGIFGQRYGTDGELAGEEFQVNTETYGAQKKPGVATFLDGAFVVVWESSGQDGFLEGVFAQLYDDDGSAAGDEFQVNAYVDFGQVNPTVETFTNGGFVVAWQSKGVDGSDESVVARRYLEGGEGIPEGPEYQVNSYILGAQHAPSIATFLDDSSLFV